MHTWSGCDVARGRGTRVGHAQVMLLRVAQYAKIGGLFDIPVAAAASASSSLPRRTSRQDTDVVQVRDDIGCADGSTASCSSAGVATGAAAGSAAARGTIAILLMTAGGKISRRRLRLSLDLYGDGGGGGRRRAIRDSQVRETGKQRNLTILLTTNQK